MSGGEVWDVTDERGIPIGATHVRGAAGWPAGRFHVVAAVCVVDADGRILVTRRGPTKDFAGMWELPAGSALSGESSGQAGSRELLEEIGLAVRAEDLRFVGRFVEDTALLDLHLAELPDAQAPRPDGVEVVAFDWIDLDELDRRTRDGGLADPWVDRLEAFRPALVAALDASPGIGARGSADSARHADS